MVPLTVASTHIPSVMCRTGGTTTFGASTHVTDAIGADGGTLGCEATSTFELTCVTLGYTAPMCLTQQLPSSKV